MERPSYPPKTAVQTLHELPDPGPEALEQSLQLSHLIRESIDAHGGRLPFADFMNLALYAPGLGYYSGGSRKFGPEGDFVTAPEISALFSRALARQVADVLLQLGSGDVLEFGAGSGIMAADLLIELHRIGALPERYFILELSGDLRARQQQLLAQRIPHLADRVHWLERLPATLRGVVVANEVLDAMPVHRFRMTVQGPVELCVTQSESGFGWDVAPPGPRLQEALSALAPLLENLPEGYESEIGIAAADWVRALADVLEKGLALLIDYGFPRREYYHPQRTGGTLMCHYRHRVHPDPLILPGLQDITAHVDFTSIAEAAADAGLSVRGFANQANFLLANGLAELVGETEDPRRQIEMAGQLKKLTLPSEMGELFKALALVSDIPGPLRGFTLRDERGRL